MNLELIAHKNGVVFLNHWDSIHGNDRVFRLNPGGTADEGDYEGEEPIWTRVNLVAELRQMVLATGEYE